MRVSYKKAQAIIREEHGLQYWKEVWAELQATAVNQGQILLRTGAKLYKRGSRYFIHGYAPDGSDVQPYI